MRKAIAATAVVVALALSFARSASAGPESQCMGQVIAGIATTWPWAHDDKAAFPPPPGSVALWIKTFGSQVGVSSVHQLQLLFCS